MSDIENLLNRLKTMLLVRNLCIKIDSDYEIVTINEAIETIESLSQKNINQKHTSKVEV